MKTFVTIFIEALCIGVILAIMMYLSMLIVPKNRIIWIAIAAFMCGAFFHIICQVTGLNDWYVKNY